jgi:hypothetical protein
MTSANTNFRVIDVDCAQLYADVLSPLEVPDQVASHITTFAAQLNELPHADNGKPQRRLATCRRRGEGRFRTQHLDAGSATPD